MESRGCGARHLAGGSGGPSRTNAKESGGHSDRPDLGGVPARGEPQHADARRRPAAVREAGGRRARLHPRDVRGDARRRGDRAALPQAPPPLAADRRRSWCGSEDEQFDIEHHVRHSALPKPGRVRELLDLCSRLHSTRLAWERPLWEAHVIEGLRDGRVGDVHQDPPRPRRRRLGDAAAAERAQHRPRPARHAGAVGQRSESTRSREARSGPQPLRGAARRAAHGAGRSPPRRPACRARWSRRSPRACATRPRRSRSTRRARSSTRASPAPAGSPPRTGRSSGSAGSARPPAPRSTTWCSRCAAARSAPTCSSWTRCPRPRWSRWSRSASTRRSPTSPRPRAATRSAAVMVPARHRPRTTPPTG